MGVARQDPPSGAMRDLGLLAGGRARVRPLRLLEADPDEEQRRVRPRLILLVQNGAQLLVWVGRLAVVVGDEIFCATSCIHWM